MIPGVHRDAVVDQAGEATFKVYCEKALPAGQVLTLKATDLDDGTVNDTATFSIHEVKLKITGTTPTPSTLTRNPHGTGTVSVTATDAATGSPVDNVRVACLNGAGFRVTNVPTDGYALTANGGKFTFNVLQAGAQTVASDTVHVLVPISSGAGNTASEKDEVTVTYSP